MSEKGTLILLEFLVQNLAMDPDYMESKPEFAIGKLCVMVKFLDFAPVEIEEESFADSRGEYKSGKSCLFAVPDFPIPDILYVDILVVRKCPEGVLPDLVLLGEVNVDFTDHFTKIMREYLLHPQDIPVCKALKKQYDLTENTKTRVVGSITISIRATCLGKLVVTRLRKTGDDSMLVKGSRDNAIFECKSLSKKYPWADDECYYPLIGGGRGIPSSGMQAQDPLQVGPLSFQAFFDADQRPCLVFRTPEALKAAGEAPCTCCPKALTTGAAGPCPKKRAPITVPCAMRSPPLQPPLCCQADQLKLSAQPEIPHCENCPHGPKPPVSACPMCPRGGDVMLPIMQYPQHPAMVTPHTQQGPTPAPFFVPQNLPNDNFKPRIGPDLPMQSPTKTQKHVFRKPKTPPLSAPINTAIKVHLPPEPVHEKSPVLLEEPKKCFEQEPAKIPKCPIEVKDEIAKMKVPAALKRWKGCSLCGLYREVHGSTPCPEFPSPPGSKQPSFDEKHGIKVCAHECLPNYQQEHHVDASPNRPQLRFQGQSKAYLSRKNSFRARKKADEVKLLGPSKRGWVSGPHKFQGKEKAHTPGEGISIPYTAHTDVNINTPLHPTTEVFMMEMTAKSNKKPLLKLELRAPKKEEKVSALPPVDLEPQKAVVQQSLLKEPFKTSIQQPENRHVKGLI